jgi:structural maintenance of chromosome 4
MVCWPPVRSVPANVILSEQLKRSKPNTAVLKEYQRREEEFLRRAKDLDETTALRDAEKQKYDSLRKQRLDEFMAGFNTISLKLKEMYQVNGIVFPPLLLLNVVLDR